MKLTVYCLVGCAQIISHVCHVLHMSLSIAFTAAARLFAQNPIARVDPLIKPGKHKYFKKDLLVCLSICLFAFLHFCVTHSKTELCVDDPGSR